MKNYNYVLKILSRINLNNIITSQKWSMVFPLLTGHRKTEITFFWL